MFYFVLLLFCCGGVCVFYVFCGDGRGGILGGENNRLKTCHWLLRSKVLMYGSDVTEDALIYK